MSGLPETGQGRGDAALGVVEANILGLGGRERGKRGQECDGDGSHIGCDTHQPPGLRRQVITGTSERAI